MSKFLSVIIPRYNETERDVFPLLSSIDGQLGIDFSAIEVIIVNDGGGSGPLDNDFLSLFHADIRQISLDTNRGPGAVRQAGLDAATGEYVMFCDADDTLHSVGVLGALIQEAETNVPDLLSSEWLEEILTPDGNRQYITHQIEHTWMHGKLLRRQFLQQNNIRFHETLRVHEDSYFLSIAAAFAQRNHHLPITSYVWRFRPDSITRRNGGIYTFESFPTFIEACSMSHKEVETRCPAIMEYKILQFVLYCYFSLQRSEWRIPEIQPFLEASEKTFSEQMAPFWHYWENADKQRIAEIYNQERAKSFTGRIETETVEQWVHRLIGSNPRPWAAEVT